MILSVEYDQKAQIFTESVFQHSKNIGLYVSGIEVENPFLVEISNTKDSGNAVQYSAESLPIPIPSDFFVSGEYVNVWIHGAGGIQMITIPVIRRSIPIKTDDEGGEGGQDESLGIDYNSEEENLSFLTVLSHLNYNSNNNNSGA